ncbi:MAG: HAMP domain-containing histidine kinase [Candidatus Marinimicrobia bacterium]|nr:HAMP domain-containing histidine kinase [Candidatus Neomarinimicrobiota bacterium]
MKKQRSTIYHTFVFILAQIAWLCLLGLWIYRYVHNVLILNLIGDKLPSTKISRALDILVFVGGCVMLVGVSFGMSMIFRNLNVQLRLTRLYDNFIASVTHELKTPLASIQLYLETLESRKVPAETIKEFYQIMLRETDRLKGLIDTILEVAGLEQKKKVYYCEVYQADEVVKTLIDELRERFNLPEEAVRFVGSAPCQCVVERNALKMLFNNLMDNAIKYSKEPVDITIRLGSKLKKILIEFQDKGIGIPKTEQRKIFQKYQRIKQSNISTVNGSGLGLYMVKEIVEYHGGKIRVFSEGENMGTSFNIELPIYRLSKKHYLQRLLNRSH